MKNLKFLIIGLILTLFSFMSANAQTVSNTYIYDDYISFICNGTSDVAYGEIRFHYVERFSKNGDIIWAKWQGHSNSLVSLITGEEFNLNQGSKMDADWIPGTIIKGMESFHVIGNMGTHLIFTIKFEIEVDTGTFTVIDIKSKCS